MGFDARVELWWYEDFSNPRLRHLLPVRVPVTRTSTRISTAATAVTITALCCPVSTLPSKLLAVNHHSHIPIHVVHYIFFSVMGIVISFYTEHCGYSAVTRGWAWLLFYIVFTKVLRRIHRVRGAYLINQLLILLKCYRVQSDL